MPTLQSYSTLWWNYPDYFFHPDSAQVKKSIGGNVDASWITNTCAIRLSRALNYSGVPVPRRFVGLKTVRGGDGKRYAFRVREMRTWLQHALGKPTFDHRKTRGAPFDKTQLASMTGIIGFDIAFSDATGHLDLWGGGSFSSEYKTSENYWTGATRISLWKAIS